MERGHLVLPQGKETLLITTYSQGEGLCPGDSVRALAPFLFNLEKEGKSVSFLSPAIIPISHFIEIR